jgi:16S rRNA (cytosine1402-N4)-methyltransferase
VLGRRVAESLNIRHDGLYVDATFGAGGYSRAILAAGARVVGIDRDQTAIAMGADLVEAAQGRLVLTEDRFSNLEAACRELDIDGVDGVVFDLGVSSMQLDRAERGFSFRHDGPLDMRMGGDGPSAADLVAVASERDLSAIIATLGEERHARGVARAIVRARAQQPITTTKQLADIVAAVVRAKPNEIHPATRTFQALRIFVNDELGELVTALAACERLLAPGGRLVVVSFHSLEDRIVKTFLADRSKTPAGSRHMPERHAPAPTFTVLTKKPVVADAAEIAENPRARSAKLRAAARTDAPPRAAMPERLTPNLPTLDQVMRGR